MINYLLEFSAQFAKNTEDVFVINSFKEPSKEINRIETLFTMKNKSIGELFMDLYEYAKYLVCNYSLSDKVEYHNLKAGKKEGKIFCVMAFPFLHEQKIIAICFDCEINGNEIKLLKFVS